MSHEHVSLPGSSEEDAQPEREIYLPETFYFTISRLTEPSRLEQVVQARDALLEQTVHTTVGVVARWADRYWASLMFRPGLPFRERERGGRFLRLTRSELLSLKRYSPG